MTRNFPLYFTNDFFLLQVQDVRKRPGSSAAKPDAVAARKNNLKKPESKPNNVINYETISRIKKRKWTKRSSDSASETSGSGTSKKIKIKRPSTQSCEGIVDVNVQNMQSCCKTVHSKPSVSGKDKICQYVAPMVRGKQVQEKTEVVKSPAETLLSAIEKVHNKQEPGKTASNTLLGALSEVSRSSPVKKGRKSSCTVSMPVVKNTESVNRRASGSGMFTFFYAFGNLISKL